DANNNTTSYSLDKLNRLTSETDAANGSDDYTYNAIGLLTQYTNKRGQNITYAYDRDGRRTGRTTVEGATAYTYDPNGNLLTVTDSQGTITRTYDSLNRVTSYTNTNDQTIGYEYDAFGNLKKLTYPDNKQVSYTYNANNQMTKVKDWNNRETNYAYDNNGRLSSITRPDGSVETYTYNAAGQLTHAIDQNGNTIINEYSYAYDADGNITDEISANEPDVNEISVDDAAMSYSAANRLTNFNGIPIPYDADGNMLKTPLGNEFGNLTFDSLNQLTDVTISGSAISYSYTYDAEGYRTSKTENGTTTNFVVDPNAELSRVLMSTTNGETTYYVYGLGLISQEKGADYRLYHYDYRGSTTAMTTLGGAVVDIMFYDAYGNMVKRTGADDTPFLYVGKYGVETDKNGLYYMRARYYNPQIQRFINVDPIRDGYNWYGYAYDNSVSYIDPIGLLLYVCGSESEQNMLIEELNYLTDYKLNYDKSSGKVYIVNDDIPDTEYYYWGNKLINKMLDDENHSTRIYYKDSIYNPHRWEKFNKGDGSYTQAKEESKIYYNNGEPGLGSDVDIILQKGTVSHFVEESPGSNVAELQLEDETFIVLAHELIHASEYMSGTTLPGNLLYRYSFYTKNWYGKLVKKKELYAHKIDEYIVVGLILDNDNRITENKIRKEHGLPKRMAYSYE
ncbi:MAG: hypothetical protein IJ062_02725, partial [Firmicutes bacterium]|nr:hypothetical protein [Bacillota bacterium]